MNYWKLNLQNEEIYIQKANIYSKKDEHSQAIHLLNIALSLTDDTTGYSCPYRHGIFIYGRLRLGQSEFYQMFRGGA